MLTTVYFTQMISSILVINHITSILWFIEYHYKVLCTFYHFTSKLDFYQLICTIYLKIECVLQNLFIVTPRLIRLSKKSKDFGLHKGHKSFDTATSFLLKLPCNWFYPNYPQPWQVSVSLLIKTIHHHASLYCVLTKHSAFCPKMFQENGMIFFFQ